MIPDPLTEIADDVLNHNKKRRAKVRTLLGWFGYSRRRTQVVHEISQALESVALKTQPNFQDEFFDNQVYFVPIDSVDDGNPDHIAEPEDQSTGTPAEIEEYEPPEEIREPVTLSIIENPTFRVSHFASARKAVVSVLPDDSISQVTTVMLMKDFDQIPVMRTTREVKGVVSWKSIAQANASGKPIELATHCMTQPQIIEQSDSMFEAVDRVLKYGCVLVRNQKREISGIITAHDVAKSFHELAKPYLLVGEIERLLRNLIANHFTQEDIRSVKKDDDREINDVTDLTFGQYRRLLENPANWDRLSINVERNIFVARLEEIRIARNEVMHFDPEGLLPEQKRQLWEFANFLHNIC
ncbi:CBS domain-containing protein [Neorhodopirellula lusitana]|uniref:CBS domain-containing protein n=1 Tax=Neorhodopirellula lusitana TaxID=445327 RepID=A0ABY1Q9F6_9BACT|nr:CBS domain-containing protein [Neorhodopirellula lusitana]SMP64247.1 CBS domain-containing protein [Neorhodopirellula lusitana]